MSRSILLAQAGAIGSLVLLAGCPDPANSRDPQTMAEIADLRAEIDGLQARVTALENDNKEQPGVVIEQTFTGGSRPVEGPGAEGAAQPTPPPEEEGSGEPAGTSTSEEEGATSSAGDGGDAGPDVASSGEDRALIEPREGYDAWNELNPREEGEQPAKGGRVRVRLSSQPDKLNSYLDNSAVTGYILNGYLYETLLDQDPVTFEYEPLLAESWETDDMLFEVVEVEPIDGVEFDPAQQKWVESGVDAADTQRWWPWEIRETGDGHELLELKEHIGAATQTEAGWTLETPDGAEKTFPAEDVAQVNRGTVFTFHLREDVTFHDGEPMTADDVVFSLGFLKCEHVDAASIRAYYEDVRPATKIDDYTVRIVYKKQYFKAIDFAGGIRVHPEHVFDPENLLENDPKAFGEQFNENPHHRGEGPVGTGPYEYVSWEQGNSVTLKRNRDYWDPDEGGYLDTIEWKFINENQTALASLREGSIDVVPELTPEQFFKETDRPSFENEFVKPVYYIGNFSYVGWNMRHPPFDERKVRRAMAHGALDLPAFIRDVRYGAGVQVAGPNYIFGEMYDHSVEPYEFDPEKARRLLREAGWFDRDGNGIIENANRQPFSFELLLPQGSSTARQMAAIMEENLRDLGIELSVRELEWAVFIENIRSRQFDACTLGWVQPPTESDPFQIWHSSQSENRGSNHVGFVNDEADQLILGIRRTLDEEERRQKHFRLQRMLYEVQPYLFLYCSPELGAYDPKYHGVRFIPFRPGYDLTEWYVPEEDQE